MRAIETVVRPDENGRPVKYIIRSRLMISHREFMGLKYRGRMCLDGEPVRANCAARAGQRLTLCFPDERGACAPPDKEALSIAYEDDSLIVVNKPAPLPCQCSVKQEGVALENRFANYLPSLPFRPVNRLDKGTSGLMVCAKSAHAQMLLSRQLHTNAFTREYYAIVCGAPPLNEGVVDAPIGKADGATIRREVRKDGKRAVTRYRLIESRGSLSLVSLKLETGRTHQIRVHLAHIGCPVFGDFLYGEERANALPGRFALHSRRVALEHPETGERLCFESPLPPELQRILLSKAFIAGIGIGE